jgi:hypothetical protein
MKRLFLLLVLLMPMFANADGFCAGMWTDHNRFTLTSPHDQTKCHECVNCHLNGNLNPGGAGGGATCNSCHLGSRPLAKPKNAGHIQTSLDCITCHRLASTFEDGKMNHLGISTGCASCHHKSAGHPEVTNPNCEACHSTSSWKCGG